MPTRYGEYVRIVKGPYRGESGQLIGDCSGFEMYRIRISTKRKVCVRGWHLEKW